MKNLLKRIFLCGLFGFHDWTSKALQGIPPTKEDAEGGELGFWIYAKMYCKCCGKVSELSKKPIDDCIKKHYHPVSYQTVDVAVIKKISPYTTGELNHSVMVLMGKRRHEAAYRLIGGFVDVEDNSLEIAAKRELQEESGDIQTTECKYVGSFRVDDPRYKNRKDAIMTALFICEHISGEPVANDDIHEVRWFELKGNIPIVKEHEPLLNALRNKLCLE